MTLQKLMRPIIGSMFVLLVFGFTHALLGQAVNGTLLGTVTDSTGAAIANAQVTATLTSTGAIHQSTTNASGNYTFPGMQPGIYTTHRQCKRLQEGRAAKHHSPRRCVASC